MHNSVWQKTTFKFRLMGKNKTKKKYARVRKIKTSSKSECKKKQVAAYTAWMAREVQSCCSPSEFVHTKIPLPLLPSVLGGTAQPLTGLDLLQKKNNNMPLLSI